MVSAPHIVYVRFEPGLAQSFGLLPDHGQCGSNPWRSDGAITSGLPTMQELSHRVRAKRRAACALLKAQGIGHPRGVYWIGGAPPLLHLLFYKVVENNVVYHIFLKDAQVPDDQLTGSYPASTAGLVL